MIVAPKLITGLTTTEDIYASNSLLLVTYENRRRGEIQMCANPFLMYAYMLIETGCPGCYCSASATPSEVFPTRVCYKKPSYYIQSSPYLVTLPQQHGIVCLWCYAYTNQSGRGTRMVQPATKSSKVKYKGATIQAWCGVHCWKAPISQFASKSIVV